MGLVVDQSYALRLPAITVMSRVKNLNRIPNPINITAHTCSLLFALLSSELSTIVFKIVFKIFSYSLFLVAFRWESYFVQHTGGNSSWSSLVGISWEFFLIQPWEFYLVQPISALSDVKSRLVNATLISMFNVFSQWR